MQNPFQKGAAKPYVPNTSPELADQSNEAKAEALRRMIRSGLLSFALSAGGTAAMSLPGLLRGSKIPSSTAATEVDLPYPQPVNKIAGQKKADDDPWFSRGALKRHGIQWAASAPAAAVGDRAAQPLASRIGDATRTRRLAGRATRGAGAFAGGLLGWSAGGALADRVGAKKPKKDDDEKKAGVAGTLLSGIPAAGLGGLIGGIRHKNRAEDPNEGFIYGARRGALQGMGLHLGNLGGLHMGSRAGLHAIKRVSNPGASIALALGAPLAGQVAGGTAGFLGGGRVSDRLVGPPPKAKKTEKTEKKEKKADFARSVVNSVMPTKPGQPGGTMNWLRGDTHTDPQSVPWQMPAAVLAGSAGAAGGHALVNYLLKKHRKSNIDQELEAAQQEYDNAMLSQYDPEKLRNLSRVKSAASTTNLDVCFDALKSAGLMDGMNDLGGQGAGAYLTLASLLGLGTAAGTKKWLDSRSGEKTLADALKRRQMIRNLQSPPEVHVTPVPVEYVNE